MQLLNIVRNLDRRQFHPVIVTLSPEPGESMLASFREIGVEIRSLAMSRIGALFHRDWRRDIEQLLGFRLDGRSVIHSQGIRGDTISARWLGGLPRVTTARNYPHADYLPKFGPLLGRWMASRHLLVYRSLPTVVACSSTLSESLARHGISSVVIRNGVDTSKFTGASSEERARLRSELGLAAEARIGVCVGALSARKDPLQVILAAREVDVPSLSIVFVGRGSLEDFCCRAAEGDGRFRFVGQLADAAPYLRAADFFVSASHSEGLPNAALEAIACGLYCVLSDIGPHREILELAPWAGELFAVRDLHALAAALKRVTGRTEVPAGLATGVIAETLGAKFMSERYQELYLRLGGDPAQIENRGSQVI
jgi:glycosyltransferase involved in cell wall biosynthesis